MEDGNLIKDALFRLQSKLDENIQRTIHIEQKIDCVNQQLSPEPIDHPDQWFGGRTYSQHGEDHLILNIFQQLGIEKPDYIDIGAHHPINISNTALMYRRGSRGINIEANPNLIGNFLRQRDGDINVNVGVGPQSGVLRFYMIDRYSGRNTFSYEEATKFVQENPQFRITQVLDIPVLTINDILQTYYDNKCPKFMSIDVEGLDYEILRSIDFDVYRPFVICVESPYRSHKALTIKKLLIQEKYNPYCRCGENMIFVSQDFPELLEM